jgi:hypothetical protein
MVRHSFHICSNDMIRCMVNLWDTFVMLHLHNSNKPHLTREPLSSLPHPADANISPSTAAADVSGISPVILSSLISVLFTIKSPPHCALLILHNMVQLALRWQHTTIKLNPFGCINHSAQVLHVLSKFPHQPSLDGFPGRNCSVTT